MDEGLRKGEGEKGQEGIVDLNGERKVLVDTHVGLSESTFGLIVTLLVDGDIWRDIVITP